MKGKGFAGWLILVAALAIPGLLFFNWWSRQSAANRAELEKRVRSRLPPGTPMFDSPSAKDKLANPLEKAAPVPAAAASASATASTSPVSGVAASTGTASVAAAPVKAADSPAAAAPSAAPAPVAAAPAAAQAPAASANAAAPEAANAPLARDPTLSPYDMVRLEQLALEEENRKRELTGVRVVHVRKYERPIENDIELQGIVATDDGVKAIINGDMVGEGQSVKGAKVLKITSQTVVFTYKGRRFSKTISR